MFRSPARVSVLRTDDGEIAFAVDDAYVFRVRTGDLSRLLSGTVVSVPAERYKEQEKA